MSAAPKPPNTERRLPTVSFSLPEAQIERLRELAWARNVSLSQIAREALDVAFACWATGACSPVTDDAERDPMLPRRWPRDLRRQAARDGAVEAKRVAMGTGRQERRQAGRRANGEPPPAVSLD